MKRIMMAVMVAAGALVAQALSLADARAKIGEAVVDPSVLGATIKQLSAEDQKSYLADVNEAIAKMPGSNESKAATFLNANRAALKNAQKGNLSVLLAEVFATVPVETLTVLNERFAAELFNRSADPSVTYTDEKFTAISKTIMEKISARVASADDAAVRDTFAVVMFVRASNGTPADLAQTLSAYIPEKSRDVAVKEWIPAATAMGDAKSYAGMLGSADAGQEPNIDMTIRIAGQQLTDALFADLNAVAPGHLDTPTLDTYLSNAQDINRGFNQGGGFDAGLDRVPFYAHSSTFGTRLGSMGSGRKIGNGPSVSTEPVDMYFGWGQDIPAGSKNIGSETITIRTVDGRTETLAPGESSSKGGTVISPNGANVQVPAGTILAPGGTAVGPNGKPIGPGNREIDPGDSGVGKKEPGGYQNQY